jgi:hypothetical protein
MAQLIQKEDLKQSTNDIESNSKKVVTKSVKAIQKAIVPTDEKKAENFRDSCIGLFGEGFTDTEYKILWEKYSAILKNYQLKSELHKEMLIKYCKYALREETAIANNDVESAKQWGQLANKVADSAKINPSKLSSDDLTDGITGFAQLATAVEKAKNIVDVLPKYKDRPQDKADMILWFYITYICKVQNKPVPEYKEIYSFMQEMFKKNAERYKDILKTMEIIPQDSDKNDK